MANYKRKKCRRHGRSAYYSERWYGNTKKMRMGHGDSKKAAKTEAQVQDYQRH